jgi:polyhydroxyalkanoate synthase subunit PhaC
VPLTPSMSDNVGDLLRAPFAAPFAMSDLVRRAQGELLASSGFGPHERPYRVTRSGPFWCLRDYGGDRDARPLLVVAAPIKRPYVWDMGPSASAIGCCLEQGFHVHLIEWTPASAATCHIGLEDFADAISASIADIAARVGKPALIGHSLGGTLAAIHCAYEPDAARGAALLSASVSFAPGSSAFRDALVAMVPRDISERQPFSGSLLSHVSALACPEAFVWERFSDALLSMADAEACAVHASVERWALDEVPLAGRLVRQLVNWLYREDRFQRGELEMAGNVLAPSEISVPMLAVVNKSDSVAPLASIKPFLDRLPAGPTKLIEHDGEMGVGLQHLAILVGRRARAHVWPQIVAWLRSLD